MSGGEVKRPLANRPNRHRAKRTAGGASSTQDGFSFETLCCTRNIMSDTLHTLLMKRGCAYGSKSAQAP